MFTLGKHIPLVFACLAFATSVKCQDDVSILNPPTVITTAGFYDPYWGNATRSVVDVKVHGAVTTTPFAFGRNLDTRFALGAYGGYARNWRTNWSWILEWTNVGSGGLQGYFTLYPPSGGPMQFNVPLGQGAGWYFASGALSTQLLQTSTNAPTVYLPDGTQILFHLVSNSSTIDWFYPTSITDPYGQTIQFSYSDSTIFPQTLTLTEPAGRWIKITNPFLGLSEVDTSDGQKVTYSYSSFTAGGSSSSSSSSSSSGSPLPLPTPPPVPPPPPVPYQDISAVNYEDGTQANYSYVSPPGCTSDASNARGPVPSLLQDVRYSGPMQTLAYQYSTQSPTVAGIILGEANQTTGTLLSQWSVTPSGGRMETRADNERRSLRQKMAIRRLNRARATPPLHHRYSSLQRH
jgi:hypothetical protein